MITLEQLIKNQKCTGMSDIQIVKTFFDLNNMEEEGMELIYELSKNKIEKLKQERRTVRQWTSYLPSKYLYDNYDLEIADDLHTLELDFISHGLNLTEGRLEWAREHLPNIERPQVYFNPLVDWLKDRGIEFKSK